MAVLIKGIDMPQNCVECPFRIRLGWENRIVMACKFMASIELVDPSTRAEDCPLIELPPHGDLIDRDAMLEGLDKRLHPVAKYANKMPTIIEADGGKT